MRLSYNMETWFQGRDLIEIMTLLHGHRLDTKVVYKITQLR